MTEKIQSSDVAPGSVTADPEQRHRHRSDNIKLVFAVALVSLGTFIVVLVLFGLLDEKKHADNAWQLLTVLISTALGYLYGARDRH